MANSFVNKKADLTSTDQTTLYTVPTATTAIIKSILVSDDSGSGSNITIQIVTSADATFSVAHQKTISANTPTEILTNPLVVETGEIVKVTAGHANRLHVLLSAMEVLPRTVTT
jgi:hypothetical protein|tara:strand:- start:113 stop:454 length:342 start_codon:yes stop_codon:yes gene_type:complete